MGEKGVASDELMGVISDTMHTLDSAQVRAQLVVHAGLPANGGAMGGLQSDTEDRKRFGESVAAALKSVRDGHAAWDRKRREFNNCIERSRRNQS